MLQFLEIISGFLEIIGGFFEFLRIIGVQKLITFLLRYRSNFIKIL